MNVNLILLLLSVSSWYGQFTISQVPYVTFMGERLPNNSFVDLSLVGNNDSNAIVCHTDLTTCCRESEGQSRGEWQGVGKRRLPYPLYQSNETQAVEIRGYENQYAGNDYYYIGLYRCAIETAAVNGHMGRASVYIGLYNATSGKRNRNGEIYTFHITMQLLSEPYIEPLIYSVTCRATYGPITHSNFTRNRKELGQLQPQEESHGVYKLKYITSGRDGVGDYFYCLATNNKPSQRAAGFRIAALEPPTNIILEYSTIASGIATITVSWTHCDSGPKRHGYVTVYYDGLRKVKIESNADENNATIVVEENSQQCRSYTVTVVAIRYSYYLPSAPVVTKRIENGILMPPTIVRIKPEALLAKLYLKTNQPAEKYIVHLNQHCNPNAETCAGTRTKEFEMETNSLERKPVFTVSELQPYTDYTVTVVAVSDVCDRSEPSERSTFQTLPAAPGPVHSLQTVSKNFTHVVISWSEPRVKNGEIIAYQVIWWLLEDTNARGYNLTNGVETSLALAIPSTATANSTLAGTVNACTRGGEGPETPIFPEKVTCLPMPSMLIAQVFNATAVKLSWMTDPPPNGIEKDIVYEVFHFASSLVNVTRNSSKFYSVVVQVDDSSPGLVHRFELKQRMGDEYTGDSVKAEVKFDKEPFQIQFGPLESCIYWGAERAQMIEESLKSAIVTTICDTCNCCSERAFHAGFIRPGIFLCNSNPVNSTYRSTIVKPSKIEDLSNLLEHINDWVMEGPKIIIDYLVVSINKNCNSTALMSLVDDPECPKTQSSLPPQNINDIGQVIGSCAVQQFKDLCDP